MPDPIRIPLAAPFVALLLLGLALTSCGGDRPFSSAEWKANRAERRTGSAMVGMARSLVRDRTLVGKSLPEITELLGIADPQGDGGLEWVLSDMGLGDTYWVLDVRLDSKTVVTSATVEERPS